MTIRILAILVFLILLLFPKDTISGASTGLLLWFQTVLPTLLPCMILADYLIRIQADRYLTGLFYRPLSLLFGLTREGTYAMFIGFLCGYPMGAKTTASLVQTGQISQKEAAYLLSFCNQPSPMFLLGYLSLSLFSSASRTCIPAVLIGIYGSALLISLINRSMKKLRSTLTGETAPSTACVPQKTAVSSPLTLLEHSMMSSFEVMVKIGGYMMLFSILEALVLRLPFLPDAAKYMLMGFVEMTTGCQRLAEGFALPWSAALCCAMTAFGGLSGFAQTANVIQGTGLSARPYFEWKLLQGILAGILVILYFFLAGVYPGSL